MVNVVNIDRRKKIEPPKKDNIMQKERKLTLGIDPGKSGAAVLLGLDKPLVHRWDTPRKWIEFITDCKSYELVTGATMTCYLEKVHGMPNQSSVATFNFGENFGMIKMSLVANQIDYELITPQRWMKEYKNMLSKVKQETKSATAARKRTARKAVLREKAAQLFPDEAILADTADAYLIATYGHNL
jgi:hypothetical protein